MKLYNEPTTDEKVEMLDEAIFSVTSAIEYLTHKTGYFDDIIGLLKDALDEMQPQYGEAIEELAAERAADTEDLTREYYHSVL